MIHGRLSTYTNHRCRCDECRAAAASYRRARPRPKGPDGYQLDLDREALADLLHELFPFGLTDDCPARRALQPVGAVHSEP